MSAVISVSPTTFTCSRAYVSITSATAGCELSTNRLSGSATATGSPFAKLRPTRTASASPFGCICTAVSMRAGIPAAPATLFANVTTLCFSGETTTSACSIPLSAHSRSTCARTGSPAMGRSSFANPREIASIRVPLPPHGMIALRTSAIRRYSLGHDFHWLRRSAARHQMLMVVDHATIRLAHRANAPLEIVETYGVQLVVLVAKRMLPIDLVGERVPREAAHGTPADMRLVTSPHCRSSQLTAWSLTLFVSQWKSGIR